MRIHSLRSVLALAFVGALFSCAEAPTAPEAPESILLSPTIGARLVAPSAVISQVYGGGGNSGSTLRNDFIEIFNPTASPISLAGWSVQYQSATGTATWQVTTLTGTLAPGQYYLVQEAAQGGGTVNLPTPDASGTIPMAAGAGKVALVNSTTALAGSCPSSATIVDRLAYGSYTCVSAPTPWTQTVTATLNASTAALRNDAGCAYAADAGTVFTNGTPTPRNTATALNPCDGDPEPVIAASVVISPDGGTIPVGGTLNLDAAAFDASSATIPGEVITWSSLDAGFATVDATGLVTGAGEGVARIVATASSAAVADTALVTVEIVEEPPTGPVFISEFHYDDVGADIDEKIEISGPAGASLSGWSVVLYNLTGGAQYQTVTLSGVFSDLCDGRGVLVFDAVGIQNGPNDGLALVAPGNSVVEFLSYEGTLTATNGPATGMTSTDIGVDEEPAPSEGRSLQKAPNGTWYGPNTSSFGACNGDAPPPPANTIFITGRHPADDVALPVGYEDQLFGSLLNGDGAAVPSTFTWSSETPTIASIDARGVMRGLAPGAAIIRATASDSAATTSTITLQVIVAAASGVPYNGNAEFGEPTDGNPADDFIVRHEQLTSSFNPTRNIPNWVAYEMDGAHFGAADRCDCFTYDDALPASFTRYNTADYTGAGAFHGYGIDRGHLARSFDRTSGALDNARTFLFTNIIPQAADNNQGPWSALEFVLGDFARLSNKEVYVVAGASGDKGTIKNEGIITIPEWTWKVAIIVDKDVRLADITSLSQMQVIAVVMPNVAGIRNVPWQTYEVTVDSVEALSGYDVFALLRDDLEIALESNTQPPVAANDGPYTGSEGGAAVEMSAAASSDVDNDALTFAWTFGDGADAVGAATSHTYAQDGVYNIRLIVTDVRGLADTTFTTATISNVAPSVTALPSRTLLVGETYAASGSFTDPGADSWTASVDFGDGATAGVPLSGNSWSIAHAYTSAGSFTVSLGVNDGSTTTSVAATVTVWTGAEGIAAAQVAVLAMVANGTLSKGEGTALMAKLNAAAAALERGQTATAINQLNAALNSLDALVTSGRLTAAQAAGLRELITRVIAAID
jgi:DNA/RNA endonuclease G (NUC1)